jgi:thioredoxin reductase
MIETVIIGAGPYGLSIAAHLHNRGIPFRIFGRPMDSWSSHMPRGMFLKSDGFASNIYDPRGEFTLKQYCAERGINYADLGSPVALEAFTEYGLSFQDRFVRQLEKKLITHVTRNSGGYLIQVEGGETFCAKRVILAVGITHFVHIPGNLKHLPNELFTHSFKHSDVEHFRGRSVAVIGAGASAIDLAALLHEAGADVRLVARRKELRFHQRMRTDRPRSIWENLRSPISGLGPGLRSRFFADAPNLFWYLPENLRLRTVRTSLGPSSGWFMRDRVMGKVPLILGSTIKRAAVVDGGVQLELSSQNGERKLWSQHVIAATGYKVDIERLAFLAPEIRCCIRSADSAPVLSSEFESSMAGLHFVGLASANSFGPVMRFAYGAGFAARQLAKVISKSALRRRSMSTVPEAQSNTGVFVSKVD